MRGVPLGNEAFANARNAETVVEALVCIDAQTRAASMRAQLDRVLGVAHHHELLLPWNQRARIDDARCEAQRLRLRGGHRLHRLRRGLHSLFAGQPQRGDQRLCRHGELFLGCGALRQGGCHNSRLLLCEVGFEVQLQAGAQLIAGCCRSPGRLVRHPGRRGHLGASRRGPTWGFLDLPRVPRCSSVGAHVAARRHLPALQPQQPVHRLGERCARKGAVTQGGTDLDLADQVLRNQVVQLAVDLVLAWVELLRPTLVRRALLEVAGGLPQVAKADAWTLLLLHSGRSDSAQAHGRLLRLAGACEPLRRVAGAGDPLCCREQGRAAFITSCEFLRQRQLSDRQHGHLVNCTVSNDAMNKRAGAS
mmetsp:Transcript_89585/g.231219  ORF Transcript_89585/g.231219 Transcript_89585/m.231219 type:complete len:363 (+) Transcript_89585:500-1588(+)